jgi:heme iron utilization protein
MSRSTAAVASDAARDARTLIRCALKGALATLERGGAKTGATTQGGKIDATIAGGHPYASLVTVATTPAGRPVFLLSGLALHTQNLKSDPRASLLIDGTSLTGDPLAGGRVTLIGQIVAAAPSSSARFLNRHPAACQYADFGDFAFYELDVERAHFIGGFGRIVGLSAADITPTVGDAGAFVAAEADIIAHVNADHADTLQLYARAAGAAAVGSWRITGCDPEGMDLLNGEHSLRVPFDERITTPDACRRALKRMADTARAGG